MSRSKPSTLTNTVKGGSSGDRLLAVLGLFTVDHPEWTVEAAAERLGASVTTTYRYFRSLMTAGLISSMSRGSYVLGPAIIQMDRQIQICDPMLGAARGIMVDLIQYAPEGSIILLCRLFRDRVMCVHQVLGRGPQEPVSYERGRLMPLFRGATSKIILAHLPARTLKSLFAENSGEISAGGLGRSWDEFRQALADLRRDGVSVTESDVDPGRIGIAAPIFDGDHTILGSLSFALPAARASETLIRRLASLIVSGAGEIERIMGAGAEPAQSGMTKTVKAR